MKIYLTTTQEKIYRDWLENKKRNKERISEMAKLFNSVKFTKADFEYVVNPFKNI